MNREVTSELSSRLPYMGPINIFTAVSSGYCCVDFMSKN